MEDVNLIAPLTGVMKIDIPWQDMLKLFDNQDIYMRGLEKIRSDRYRQEWLGVRLLLKKMTGTEPVIYYDNYGAPSLQNIDYKISISHTKDYVAVILNKKTYPGVDIEYHSDRAWRLRHRYMTESEMIIFENHADTLQYDLATVCWCGKETTFKAMRNAAGFLEHLTVSPFEIYDEGKFLITENISPRARTYNINYKITENYIITWIE